MIIQHVEPELNVSENVAVVASSPRLLTTEYGEFIDSFDDVVRFNRAPTDGYEKHVGAKTTIRVANNHVFGNIPHTGWETDGQPTFFIKEQENINVVWLGPDARSPGTSWESGWVNREDNIHETSKPFLSNYDEIYSTLNPITGIRPSAGFGFLWLLINSGFKPSIFGFGIGEEGCVHYWELNALSSHPFTEEREVISKWIDEGLVTFYE